MGRISELVKQGKILISDGAWGTMLQARGLAPGECPELWNLEQPEAVFDVAKSYIDAGSDMIETNSFGANRYKLMHFGLDTQVTEINRVAAQLSRKAAGPGRIVLGSVGPTGKLIMMGEVSQEELYEAFREQCIALEAGGADAVVIETMSDLEEAKCAISAARENTKLEIICTMTFDPAGPGEYYSMMGVTPAQMVEELQNTGVDVIGANCGNGAKNMIDIVKEIRSVNAEIPVLIHANAGLPEYRGGETVFPESPAEMAGYVEELIIAGANIVGGCCGTTPEHIHALCQLKKAVSTVE